MAIRRPKRVNVPQSAYTALAEPPLPDYLRELESVPGRCYSPAAVVFCRSPAPGVVCRDCSVAELGEFWEDLVTRCNAGLTKSQYERKQSRQDDAVVPRQSRQDRVMS